MPAIDPKLSDAERAAFIAAARSYLGVRWRHQGRDRRGLDCGGLVLVCLRDIGRTPADASKGYGREPYRRSLETVCALNFGSPLAHEIAMRAGDVAVFHIGRAAPNHVGIVADYVHGGLSLIHAYAINGEVVEMPLDVDWLDRLKQVYRP